MFTHPTRCFFGPNPKCFPKSSHSATVRLLKDEHVLFPLLLLKGIDFTGDMFSSFAGGEIANVVESLQKKNGLL